MEGYRCVKGSKHIVGDKCIKWKCSNLEYKGNQVFLLDGYDRYQAKRMTKIEWNEGKCIFQNIGKRFHFDKHGRTKVKK